nr:hypothetical protein [Tanacetum cinerariifolium]
DQFDGLLIAPLHFLGIATDDGTDSRQYRQRVRVTAESDGASFEVCVVSLRFLQRLGVDEYRIGVFGGEIAPVFGGTGLKQHRLALTRPGNVQRTLHLKEVAFVIQGVQFAAVEKLAGLLVAGKGVVFPRVPQPFDRRHVLPGDSIAHGVGRVLVLTEVFRRAAEPGRHNVPSRATAADVVQGGKLPRHLKGLGIADGHGGHQADLRGCRCQRRQKGQRFETVEVMGAGSLVDVQAVGDEYEVELRVFGQSGLALVPVEVSAGVGLGLRVAPFAPAVAHAVDHGAEFELTSALGGQSNGVEVRVETVRHVDMPGEDAFALIDVCGVLQAFDHAIVDELDVAGFQSRFVQRADSQVVADGAAAGDDALALEVGDRLDRRVIAHNQRRGVATADVGNADDLQRGARAQGEHVRRIAQRADVDRAGIQCFAQWRC